MIPKNVDSNSIIKARKLNKNKLFQNKEKNNNNFYNKDNLQIFGSNNYIKNNNLFENIRHNKYLIPLIEKKKTENNIFRSKIQEAPTYITDFFKKIRKGSNSKTIKYKKDNYITKNKYNFDNINNGIVNNRRNKLPFSWFFGKLIN